MPIHYSWIYPNYSWMDNNCTQFRNKRQLYSTSAYHPSWQRWFLEFRSVHAVFMFGWDLYSSYFMSSWTPADGRIPSVCVVDTWKSQPDVFNSTYTTPNSKATDQNNDGYKRVYLLCKCFHQLSVDVLFCTWRITLSVRWWHDGFPIIRTDFCTDDQFKYWYILRATHGNQ